MAPPLPGHRLPVLVAGFAWAALSVTIFAGWFVVTRFSVTHELRVWDIIALRFGGGTLLLGPVLLRQARDLPRGAWAEGLLFALLWGAPFVLLVALGLQLTSAAQASAITPALMPVFAGLIGWRMLGEAPGRPRLLGYAAIVGGVGLLAAGKILSAQGTADFGGADFGGPDFGGLAALVAGSAMWAVYTLRFRRSGLTPIQSAALICAWSSLLYLPPYLLFGLSHLDRAAMPELALQLVYQGCLMSVVALITYNRAVALLGTAAAAVMALLPVIAAALAVPVLGEIPSRVDAAAIAAIAIGVILATRSPPPRPTLRSNHLRQGSPP